MSVVQNGRVMKNRWVNRDTAEFAAKGIVFFHSQFEFPEPLPCKMYKIDQTHGSLWDHTHDYFQIWYVVRGCFTHSYLGRQYEMQAGGICIVPPYAVHRVEWMPQEKTEIIGCEFLPVSCSLLSAASARRSERTGTPPRWYPTRRRNGSTVAAIPVLASIDFVQKHYREEIRLDQICRHASLSKTNFCDVFKAYTGKTFNEYLNDLRLRHATEQLLKPDVTVAEACRGLYSYIIYGIMDKYIHMA
ncbi:helix-turn-helix transcriptional regulator [Paenibacillus apiarius]|nr:AraC family transcriptional regulator [Paenibacillus apiarius]MCY9722058.1 AraC family transcriptional regulator [Paenibacillus apiarius]